MIFANLAARTENKYAMPITESFTYDKLNRLVYTNLNDDVYSEMEYDDYGRILSKDIDGEWRFALADYSGDKPHAIKQAVYNEDAPFSFTGSHNVTYTMFDKVKEIHAGPQHVSFEYGYDHQRISMSQSNYKNTVTSKRYIGNCEIEGVSIRTYISGPMGVFAVYELSDYKSGDDGKNGGYEGLHYIHKDHLGSWTTITDEDGEIEQELSFDAWGNFRNPYTWTGANTTRPMFDRGFTGHEHLYDFGLINMKFALSESRAKFYLGYAERCKLGEANGRMYDPVMSTFLSVDNYVQSPENSQNFNRYAYCLNNPLKYTDPDGEWVQYVVGGLLGAFNGYSIGKAAGLTGWDLAWSTIGGAAVGAATAGIGNAVSSACGATLGGSAAGAFAGAGNGLIQGLATNSKTLGADVLNGLWKGGVSGLVGGYVGGDCGLYGGKAAFFSGCAANLTGQVCNYVTNADNSINWLSVGLSGLTSFAGYHAMLYQGYCEGGYKNLGVKYGEYSRQMQTIQQSMRSGREAKQIEYHQPKHGPKKDPYIAFSDEENSVATSAALYKGAKFDMHTHDEFGCDGFSDYARAIQAGTPLDQCDWHSAGVLYMLGYTNPRYLATADGHFWMMNNCTPIPIAIPNGLGFNISFSYSWNTQMVTNFNYSHLFHSYQYNFILRF